jgi:hypothetical protein
MKTLRFFGLLLFLVSCSTNATTELESFDIQKYKNYVIMSKVNDDWSDKDYYVLKNDSVAVKVAVPSWFNTVYAVGDTIK